MRRIDQLFLEYAESHQHPTNKAIHWICVPLIFLSILGLLASIPARPVAVILGEGPYANWAGVALVFILVYYVSLSVPLGVAMMLFGALCLFMLNAIARLNVMPLWTASIVIFVIAWIGQFYGHKVEGKKPSFLKDIQFLLIGPAWLMHFVFKRIGIPY